MTSTTDNSAVSAAVEMRLPAEPENVMLVRQTVEGVARCLGMSGQRLEDVKLAITEACSNVVKHAYGDAPGVMLVALDHDEGELSLSVSDEGDWLSEDRDLADEPRGMGIQIMQAVASDFELRREGAGTEVRLVFAFAEDGERV